MSQRGKVMSRLRFVGTTGVTLALLLPVNVVAQASARERSPSSPPADGIHYVRPQETTGPIQQRGSMLCMEITDRKSHRMKLRFWHPKGESHSSTWRRQGARWIFNPQSRPTPMSGQFRSKRKVFVTIGGSYDSGKQRFRRVSETRWSLLCV